MAKNRLPMDACNWWFTTGHNQALQAKACSDSVNKTSQSSTPRWKIKRFFCELDYTHHYCNEVNFMLTSVMIFGWML